MYVPRPAWDLVKEEYYLLVLESHSNIPCACILAMRAIQVSKSPFRAVRNLVLQFTFFYFNLLSFTLIYFLSLLFTFYLWNYFKLLLFTFIYLTLHSNSNFLRIYIYVAFRPFLIVNRRTKTKTYDVFVGSFLTLHGLIVQQIRKRQSN